MTLDLRALVAATPPDELPALAGQLREAELLAEQRLRARESSTLAPAIHEQAERVLTYDQAAELLGCRRSYVETLVRQRKLPTVALPGTDKGGRSREGRFRRILLSSLLEHLKASEDKALALQPCMPIKGSRPTLRAVRGRR